MSGPYTDQAVTLQRDTLSLPWGFRLQGGKDFKAPLTIQRVFVGSPADGVVHRGDVLVSIENHDTTNMFHKQAQDIIRQAGGSLRLRVRRGSSVAAARPAPPPAVSITPTGFRGPGKAGPIPAAGALAFVPKPRPPMPTSSNVPSFGHDYTQANRYPKKAPAAAPSGTMLSRVQKSLDDAIWQPGATDEFDPDFQYRNVHDLRQSFNEPHQQPAHVPVDQVDHEDYEHVPVKELRKKFGKKREKPKRARPDYPPQIELPTEEEDDTRMGMRTGKKWTPPDPSQYAGKPLYEPGWSPSKPQQQPQQQSGWAPVKPPTMHGLPAPKSPMPERLPAYEVPRLQEPSEPAWAGSLRSAGGVRPWEIMESRNAIAAQAMRAPQTMQSRRSPQPPQASPQQQQQQEPQQHLQQPQRQPRQRTRSPQPPEAAPAEVSPEGVQPHHPRVQKVHYGPGDVAPTYEQHAPDQYDGDAKIAHLQYNTPLGLYSRGNVEEALAGQTGGGAGAGTMQVTGGGPPGQKTFDPKQSSVLRMLQEQEASGRRAHQPQHHQQGDKSARYQDHSPGQEMQYKGYMDHQKQSPSMHALSCNMGNMTVEEPHGTSDF